MSSAKALGSSAAGIGQKATKPQGAFTFVELIVVVAVFISVLALVALPALARSKTRSPAAGCLSNLRQLMTGWQMYADDNSGRLMLNAPLGASSSKSWTLGAPTWSSTGDFAPDGKTYQVVSGLMGRFVTNRAVYRCPGDVVPSVGGLRARSYSMNGQIGPAPNQSNYGSPLRTYSKESDIVCPVPKDLFVLCDEHPGSMDDGYLQVSATTGSFPNVPASYLDGGCGFGFADGHGEIHKWQGNLLIPVVFGGSVLSLTIPANDPDAIWFKGKAGCQ